MTSKVVQIPKKHHSPWFVRKYPRENREHIDLTDNISEDLRQFYPPVTENTCYVVAEEPPFSEFTYFKELHLSDAVINFNPLLMYKLLKSMYGLPDVVGGFIVSPDHNNPKLGVGDWSYTLRLDNNTVSEIRSIFINTGHIIRFWTDKEYDNEGHDKQGAIIYQFGQDLNKVISNNLHLFSEKEELRKSNQINSPYAYENAFAVTYKSANNLYELANSIDIKPQPTRLQWNENPQVITAGSMYMASIVFYVIAMETLLNTLYELFLNDEYRQYPYARVTNKADLEIRLSTIHLFCKYFKHHVVPTNSELWKDISCLREFRNDIVHGNIKDEHHVHCFIEDNFCFYYSPNMDFRGITEENKTKDSFPRVMSSIDKSEVMRAKSIVDELIKNLLDAMEEESKAWVESWLHELVIPPRNI